METTLVVTVFLRRRGDVLLLKRSEDVGSYAGQWGAVAGHVETREGGPDPEASARQEIEEETGLDAGCVTLVRAGTPFDVEDQEGGTTWVVHPFLFDAPTREIEPNWETAEAEWVAPTAILRRDVVPELWTSYRRVAPSILSIADDTTHGSAAISTAALEVLRDRAGSLAVTGSLGAEAARKKIVEVAERLLAARPSMAAVQNRLHRVMDETRPNFRPLAVEGAAHSAIARAVDADRDTAARAAEVVVGQRVLTLSRSGTVHDALQLAFEADEDTAVVVAESRPAREGVDVAEALVQGDAGEERSVTVCTDAAVPAILAEGDVNCVLVGADTVRPSGAVVNKTGTRGAALAAAREEIPFYAAGAVDKIAPGEETRGEEGERRDVYDGTTDLHVRNPTFDVTPADLVTGVVTDRRTYAPDAVAAVADDHARLTGWRDDV